MSQTRVAATRSEPTARPAFHLHPQHGWLNDPNGLCRIDGRYHVFYQHNPDGPYHTNIHWAHASSTDLVHWTEEPIALAPVPGTISAQGCWSGCIVDDDGVPTAVFTAVADGPHNAVVGVARSDRTLRAWAQDPVAKIGNPADPAVEEVRDPFVFTHRGRRYAVQGAGRRHGRPQLLLYGCDDLDEWTFLGPLLTADDPVAAEVAPADIWECPNLFRLDDHWVLVFSLWAQVDASHQLVGVRYLIGDLVEDGPGLRFVARSGGSLDDGDTFYAPQVLIEPDRVLLWAWAWEHPARPAADVEAAGWAGVLTVPRELTLSGDRLVSRPAAELSALRAASLAPDGAIDRAAFEVETRGRAELRLVDRDAGTAETVVRTDGPARILVDGSVVEVFGDGPSTTTRRYPTSTQQWVLTASEAQVWALG